jgi:parallel beta-helix repeat protein
MLDCWIGGNSIGVYCSVSSPSLTNGIVTGNTDAGIYCSSSSNPVILNCTISGNQNRGIGCHYTSSPTVTNCIFENNAGWAIIEHYPDCNPVVSYCLFYANPTGDYYDYQTGGYTGANAINQYVPGASHNLDGDPMFAMEPGGTWTANYVYDGSTRLTTLTDANAAFTPGSLKGTVINPDLTQRQHWYVVDNTETTVVVAGNSYVANTGNSYQFMDYHLQDGSMALDRADVASAPSADFEGNPRPGDDSLVDMGAYEADGAFLPPADTHPPESYVSPLP